MHERVFLVVSGNHLWTTTSLQNFMVTFMELDAEVQEHPHWSGVWGASRKAFKVRLRTHTLNETQVLRDLQRHLKIKPLKG